MAFNMGDPKPLTQVELVEKLAKVANVEPTLVARAARRHRASRRNVFNDPLYFGEYYDLPPITENIGKVTRVLKMKLTPFEAGLKETYRCTCAITSPSRAVLSSTTSCWRW